MHFDTRAARLVMPVAIRIINFIEPEEIVHDEVAAEDSGFWMFTRLPIKPQTDHRVRESVREE